MDIERILKEITLEDKIALCSGASFWETKRFERYGIPALFMCDGPHGLRKQENAADMLGVNNSRPATCFPAEVRHTLFLPRSSKVMPHSFSRSATILLMEDWT